MSAWLSTESAIVAVPCLPADAIEETKLMASTIKGLVNGVYELSAKSKQKEQISSWLRIHIAQLAKYCSREHAVANRRPKACDEVAKFEMQNRKQEK